MSYNVFFKFLGTKRTIVALRGHLRHFLLVPLNSSYNSRSNDVTFEISKFGNIGPYEKLKSCKMFLKTYCNACINVQGSLGIHFLVPLRSLRRALSSDVSYSPIRLTLSLIHISEPTRP